MPHHHIARRPVGLSVWGLLILPVVDQFIITTSSPVPRLTDQSVDMYEGLENTPGGLTGLPRDFKRQGVFGGAHSSKDRRLDMAASNSGRRPLEACQDVPGWADNTPQIPSPCSMYEDLGWCSVYGGTGPRWEASWGPFAAYAAGGYDATQACCVCGRRSYLKGQVEPLIDVLSRMRAQANWTTIKTLDLSLQGLTGEIPAWLAEAQSLEELILAGNALSGPIPPELGSLPRLRVLDLAVNGFSGEIPLSLANLSRLTFLDLRTNQLAGNIPAQLGRLRALELLDVSENQLEGSLPQQICDLASLKTFVFRSNGLDGPLPPCLSQMSALEHLDGESNALSGTFPEGMGNLRSLRVVRLSSNRITGSIPAELAALPNLTRFWMGINRLSGPLPAGFGQGTCLEDLVIFGNRVSGTVPAELFGPGTINSLKLLDLSFNRFSGQLPREIGRLRRLEELAVGYTGISGIIPPELGNVGSLMKVDFSNANFEGTIPSELGNLSKLVVLSLIGNSLEGSIPSSLGKLSRLLVLKLMFNRLTGPLPAQLGNMELLLELKLNSNQLSGPLPPELGRCSKMELADFRENQFSGSIPASYGNFTSVRQLDFCSNKLTGPIPDSFGNLTNLDTLWMSDNRLSGQVPASLFRLPKLQEVLLDGNDLEGELPSTLSDCKTLLQLSVAGNARLGGRFPSIRELGKLSLLKVSGCSFTSMGLLPLHLERIDLSNNKLTQIPDGLGNMTRLREIILRQNQLSTWPLAGVYPPEANLGVEGTFICGKPIQQERFRWPVLSSLDVSDNPLGAGISVADFLHSLSYLPALNTLMAARTGLAGVVKTMVWYESSGNSDCSGATPVQQGFPTLIRLDLSGNNITSIWCKPSVVLACANLSFNMFGTEDSSVPALHPDWWNEAGQSFMSLLALQGNPSLAAKVTLPVKDACKTIEGGLVADPQSFQKRGSDHECTTLCNRPQVHYFVDGWTLNSSALCRCLPGFGGNGSDCRGCQENTYSLPLDPMGMQMECRSCPAGATARPGSTSVCACQCRTGEYLVGAGGCVGGFSFSSSGAALPPSTEPVCVHCPPFMTTPGPGALGPESCRCNTAGYRGLIEIYGLCGCATGNFLNHRDGTCQPCMGEGERCDWGAEVSRSLLPPEILPGFWAETVTNLSDFAGNSIYQCLDGACPGNGTCATARFGVACGLCEPGYYTGIRGGCLKCTVSKEVARVWTGLAIILIVPIVVAVRMILLFRSRKAQTAVVALVVTLRQLLAHVQVLSTVSRFQAKWPPWATQVMFVGGSLAPKVVWWGIACLGDRQSASLEFGARWLPPAIVAVVTFATAFLLRGLLYPLRRLGKYENSWLMHVLTMDLRAARDICVWAALTLYSTLLQHGFLLFTCVKSPNGLVTLATFPHVVCRGPDGPSAEWLEMLPWALVYCVIFCLGPLICLVWVWRTTLKVMVETDFKELGQWAFVVDYFRCSHVHWPLMMAAKDLMINIVGASFAGSSTGQLLGAAIVQLLYSYLCLRELPYKDVSNTYMEVWVSMSVFVLCASSLVSQQDPTLDDTGPRIWSYCLDFLAMAGPAGIMTYQAVVMFERSREWLPPKWQPFTEKEKRLSIQKLSSQLQVPQHSNLHAALIRFDDVELTRFRQLIVESPATLGLFSTDWSATRSMVRARMSRIRVIHSQKSMDSIKEMRTDAGIDDDQEHWHDDLPEPYSWPLGSSSKSPQEDDNMSELPEPYTWPPPANNCKDPVQEPEESKEAKASRESTTDDAIDWSGLRRSITVQDGEGSSLRAAGLVLTEPRKGRQLLSL